MVPMQNAQPQFEDPDQYFTPDRIHEVSKDLPHHPKTEECPSYEICNDVSHVCNESFL